MDSALNVAIDIHAIERLAVVLIGLCLVLGWRLFSKNLDHSGRADLSHAGWRVSLQRIGPGTFFALFGAGVLIASLVQPITASTAMSAPAGAAGDRVEIKSRFTELTSFGRYRKIAPCCCARANTAICGGIAP
jgi:hypothetical protein